MKKAALPVNCYAQKRWTAKGPVWEIFQRKVGERWAKVIAKGDTLREARDNARDVLGLTDRAKR